jgi:hypothetical protein
MNDGQRNPLGLFRQLIAEDLTEEAVDDRMEAFLAELVAVLL